MQLMLLSFFFACKDKNNPGNNGNNSNNGPSASVSTTTVTTGSDGTVAVELELEKGESSFLITGLIPGNGMTALEYIDAPDGSSPAERLGPL